MNTIVIGAGIFGSTIAHALTAAGRQVTVIDDGRPMSGSYPSGCLMKPSWVSSLSSADYDRSLALLDRTYGVQELELSLWPLRKKVRVHRVEQRLPPVLDGRVTAISGRKVTVDLLNGTTADFEPELLVVAAGIWCNELMGTEMVGKIGASFVWDQPNWQDSDNVIRPWAPYKQVVAYRIPGSTSVWAGDGSAIKQENWDRERLERSANRCADAISLSVHSAAALTGIRPFAKDKPCLLEQREPGVWLATGGGKNGTIAAGWAAHRILEATS